MRSEALCFCAGHPHWDSMWMTSAPPCGCSAYPLASWKQKIGSNMFLKHSRKSHQSHRCFLPNVLVLFQHTINDFNIFQHVLVLHVFLVLFLCKHQSVLRSLRRVPALSEPTSNGGRMTSTLPKYTRDNDVLQIWENIRTLWMVWRTNNRLEIVA